MGSELKIPTILIFPQKDYNIADSVNIGKHVTDSKPIRNVVREDGTTHIRAKSVKLMPGTLVKRGSQLRITND